MAPAALDDVETMRNIVAKEDILLEHNDEDRVAFGGDDQWFYNPSTKRFDLSRGSATKLILDADDGIRNHRGVMIDPAKSLFVIIDMQNYFIHPSVRDHSGGLAAVAPTLAVLAKCRTEGIQVCWLNWGLTEHALRAMPPAVTRGFSRAMAAEQGHGWHVALGAPLPAEQGRCLFTGTWNADIYAPLKDAMRAADVRFDKARMSGLWSPAEPMHAWLRASGKKTLLFAGVNTDQCLLGTLTDAYSWGWDCILLGDCAATMTGLGAQEVCDHNIATNMGFVTDSATFCAAQTLCSDR